MAVTRPAGGMVRFAQEAWQELQKVTWPTRETVIRLTFVVILISALVGVYIFVWDNIFTTTITRGILGDTTAPTEPLSPVVP